MRSENHSKQIEKFEEMEIWMDKIKETINFDLEKKGKCILFIM